ncbi:hypothetical protein KPH14_010506 [Odynerus spinipes]|uniref:DUF1279 domain-containing protein n=1 Tax=Odynerus spinipes TaxID=1348599 RepID=A0AAD9RU26_9HYME|nr:hypothetical protein KPH14_010506 [Odynerus spinipes]
MEYSTNAPTPENVPNVKNKRNNEILVQNRKEALKILVRDYGQIAILFHVGISLISLGICYVSIISGVDLTSIIETFVDTSNEKVIKILNTSSGFVLAYAVHKLFAPLRLAATCSITPLLVNYLRKKGVLKTIKGKKPT